MSRTYKDRPYWVIMNDRSLGTVEDHDHRYLPWRSGRYKIVKYGERQLVPYGEHKWFLRHTDGVPGMTVEEDQENRSPYGMRYYDPLLMRRSGALRWYYEQPQRYEYVGREVKEIPDDSAGLCDIGPRRRGGYLQQPDCTIDPLTHNTPYFKYNRPDSKEFRQGSERARRRNASQAMHMAAMEYNTHGEVDDFDFAEIAPPHAPYGGGWWD